MSKQRRKKSQPPAIEAPKSRWLTTWPTRTEWVLTALIVSIGVAVRVAHLSRVTVEHFDEGVYASNLWFGDQDAFQYPQRHLYAPPLMPWLIEWAMILTGRASGLVATAPSLCSGSLTLIVLWLLARRSFGPTAAAIAASLAAVSGLHILLSRSALTDASLLMWVTLAMLFLESAERTQRLDLFVLAGLSVSLGWWTKYNGWLPLFVAAAALMIQSVVCSRFSNQLRRQLIGWSLASVVAFVGWSPYLLSLQSRGGYSAVAANHQQYLVGFSGWWNSFSRQLGNLVYISGWWNTDVLSLGLGCVGGTLLLRSLWRSRREAENAGGPWLILTWFVLLGIMTPLYTPYPRLLLPWLAASWVLAGIAVENGLNAFIYHRRETSLEVERSEAVISRAAVLMSGAVLIVGSLAGPFGRVWSDRNGLARIASQIRQEIDEVQSNDGQLPSVIYVYGEPALFYQLRATGIATVSAIQTVELSPATANGFPVPTFLAVGPHARRDPKFQEAWPKEENRYQLIKKYSFQPSPLVLLDSYSAKELRHAPRTEEIHLFQMQ